MSQEHQSQNHDLLTPEEAQQVIKLYAEREKKRREEAERLAAMPKLEDLSSLLNLPMQAVRDLAYEVKKQVNLPIELDELGNEHVPQKLADLIIARAGQIEKAKQAEQERLARMASLTDIASGLGINENEAASLLKEVRMAMAPPVIDPKVEEARRKEELAKQAAYRQRMSVLLRILAVLICLWVLTYILLLKYGTVFLRRSYYPQQVGVPEREAIAPTSSSPPVKVGPAPGRSITHADLATFICPPGWSIAHRNQSGSLTVGSPVGQYRSDHEALELLKQGLMAMHKRIGGYTGGNGMNPVGNVPFVPLVKDQKTSDIVGWDILEVANKDGVRQVYVNNDGSDRSTVSGKADYMRRLQYLIDGKLPASAVKNQKLTLVRYPLPVGLNISLFGGGKCYRVAGTSQPNTSMSEKSMATYVQNSVLECAEIVVKKGAKPGNFMLMFATDRYLDTVSFDEVLNFANDPSQAPDPFRYSHDTISKAVHRYRFESSLY